MKAQRAYLYKDIAAAVGGIADIKRRHSIYEYTP
jgi:hypothetical protein